MPLFQKGHVSIVKKERCPVDMGKKPTAESSNLEVMIYSAKHSPYSRGRDLWLRMAEKGELLTPVQMILAKCAECCCFYFDGRMDCQVEICSLYRKMPYGKYRKVRKQGKAV
jgi:hypothetical protein